VESVRPHPAANFSIAICLSKNIAFASIFYHPMLRLFSSYIDFFTKWILELFKWIFYDLLLIYLGQSEKLKKFTITVMRKLYAAR